MAAFSSSYVRDDGTLNLAWLSDAFATEVIAAVFSKDSEKMGGMSAEMKFIDVTFAAKPDEVVKMVVKIGAPNASKAAIGTPREAYFYKELSTSLVSAGTGLSKCYYAKGDMVTGEMLLFLECLTNAVPCGVFFGASNPNNWGVKDKLDALCEGNPSAVDATCTAFKLYARLHAAYWKPDSLLQHTWLRGADWTRGEGAAGWEQNQKLAADSWQTLMAAKAEGTSPYQWDDHLIACLNVAFSKVSFDAYQKEIKTRPSAVVQGDCHPHNALWVDQRTEAARLCLIDFEMVGVGSGPQELGQWMISHMQPTLRRKHERELVQVYYEELQCCLKKSGRTADAAAFTFENCWAEYVAGGIGRWAWFVAYLPSMLPYPAMNQFFHDQLAAFLADHCKDPDAMPMPRV